MTKVIAHRGAKQAAPQNTLPAFILAKEMGAQGFENDVHYTADGHIVVCHDYAINTTSNGSGLIIEMTLEELRKFDFGSYFSSDYANTKIPTLEEFFEVAKGLDVINVEIKRPLNGNYDIVGGVIEMAKNMGVYDNLLISSFDDAVLIKAHELDPNCKTGLLYDPGSPIIDDIIDDPVTFAKNVHACALHPVLILVDEDLIKEAHENNMSVNVWTVNDANAIENLVNLGCDGIITDVPDFALATIANLNNN